MAAEAGAAGSGDAARPDGRGGFALLLVLWIFALLSLIGVRVAASARADLQLAANIAAEAQARALLDAALALAAYELLQQRPGLEHPMLAGAVAYPLPDGVARVAARSAAGKINPSRAAEPVMAAFLEASGVELEPARRIAAAIGDWVDKDDQRRPDGAEAGDYDADNAGYRPANAPFMTEGELLQVRGMTAGIFQAIRPFVSIYVPLALPEAALAVGPVRAAVARSARAQRMQAAPVTARADAGAGAGAGDATTAPAGEEAAGRTAPVVYEVEIEVHGDRGATLRRQAVIELDPTAPAGFRTLDWQSL